MNITFYTGVSGMISYQKEMDALAHNMANVNTIGYKPSRMNFMDNLYTEMYTNKDQPLAGHGVRPIALDLLYQQGTPVKTEHPLDFALLGDGFFAVDRGGESLEYTRNGAFDISIEGNKGYLVSADGGYILDDKGKKIELSKIEGSNIYDTEGLEDKIGIYTFSNPYGLQTTDGASFLETPISGTPEAMETARNEEPPCKIIPKALEYSAVDIGQAMVDVMMSQRAFQLNSKVVSTADGIEELLNNLR